MPKIPIIDIIVRHKSKNFSVNQHPYYLSLSKNDENILDNFMKISSENQNSKKSATFAGLCNLSKKLKSGFNPKKNPLRLILTEENKYMCCHGRHRMCILAHLYPNGILVIKNNIVVDFVKN